MSLDHDTFTAPAQEPQTLEAMRAELARLRALLDAVRPVVATATHYVSAMDEADALQRTQFPDDEVRAAWDAAGRAYDALERALAALPPEAQAWVKGGRYG